MSEVIIKAVKRENIGTGASRRLRREGKIPAIIYGSSQDPISIEVEHNAIFFGLKNERFHTAIHKIDVDGQELNVMIRDFQMHPFKPFVQHVDFQVVDMAKPVRVKIPLHLVNAEISPAVKLHGGRVSQLATNVEVIMLPKNIPEFLELDLSQISGGQILHLSDVTLPEGAESLAAKAGRNPPVASATGKNK